MSQYTAGEARFALEIQYGIVMLPRQPDVIGDTFILPAKTCHTSYDRAAELMESRHLASHIWQLWRTLTVVVYKF